MKVEEADISPIIMKKIRIEEIMLRSRDEAYQQKLRRRLAEAMPGFESESRISPLWYDPSS